MSTENINTTDESQTTSESKRSFPRVAVGVAAASGGALLAVSLVGVAPAVIAGAAGYFAYYGIKSRSKSDQAQ